MNVKVHVISDPSEVILAKYFNSKRFEGSFKIVGQIRLFRKEILPFIDFQALESLHKKVYFLCFTNNFKTSLKSLRIYILSQNNF